MFACFVKPLGTISKCHAANQQKTASEQMPEHCLLSCQQLTPKPHTRCRCLTLATKAVSGQTPGEITPLPTSLPPAPLPGLSAGLTRGQRAGRSSGRLRNVFLTGCKDKQITRLRRGLLVVMSYRFTPEPFGSRANYDLRVSGVTWTL